VAWTTVMAADRTSLSMSLFCHMLSNKWPVTLSITLTP